MASLKQTGSSNYISVGEINVIEDYAWAIFDGKSLCDSSEVPSIMLTEYQPVGDQFAARAEKFIYAILDAANGNSGSLTDSYKNTYKAKPTGNIFVLPYFCQSMRSRSNNWATDETIKNMVAGGTDIIPHDGVWEKALEKAVNIGLSMYGNNSGTNAAGQVGIEYPKIWQGPSEGETYSFDFYLHNTLNENDVVKNWELCQILTNNNSYNRQNILVQNAPVLYQVQIPGIRNSPVAVMKSLNISMVGQMRAIPRIIGSSSKAIIPEAYHIEITMEDLYAESRNILGSVIDPNTEKVTVFNEV